MTAQQASRIYASEADVLNVALFGMTALEWRDAHPDLKGNIRDYAGVNELICLSNMESLNAVLINGGLSFLIILLFGALISSIGNIKLRSDMNLLKHFTYPAAAALLQDSGRICADTIRHFRHRLYLAQ